MCSLVDWLLGQGCVILYFKAFSTRVYKCCVLHSVRHTCQQFGLQCMLLVETL